MASNSGPFFFDFVEHAIDHRRDALLKLLDPPRRERRHQQAANAGVLLAVHLRDELRVHEFVELLPARALGHFGVEGLGVGEHLVHVGIAADHDLRRALAEHVERRAAPPLGHVPVGVGLELVTAEIDVDDVAAVELVEAVECGERGHSKLRAVSNG